MKCACAMKMKMKQIATVFYDVTKLISTGCLFTALMLDALKKIKKMQNQHSVANTQSVTLTFYLLVKLQCFKVAHTAAFWIC